ncbi:hypothetical protein C8A03DRAFT_16045 [Achaetomium macrosporum]|uniref:Uncharacterized protein n=1 Tax=Achaetomium macrosporum TaxID=79813 RepID=A0AAN7C8U3_9PEZI|nr:hypothetical protein C8A03DRAFT_16045 [Achaetomium macrosporum]
MATVAKPLNSPLPPLPSKFTGPAPMSIPRRPVAAPMTPIPALAPASSPGLASPNPMPSPVGSISSLLSAYSNHTADSPQSPSENSGKAILSSTYSYSIVSPTLDTQRSSAQSDAPAQALPPLPRSDQNAQTEESNGRRIFEQGNEELPPPLPLKDAQPGAARPQTPTTVQAQTTQPKTSSVAGSPLGNDSPQQEQLWRRRSRSLKNERRLAVPELKLISSHGSTAASAQNTAQSGPSSSFSQPITLLPGSDPETSKPATAPRAPPRGANGGLPGRNIRPEPVSEQATAQGEASMGQDASRIKDKLHTGKTKPETAEEPNKKSQEAQANPAATSGPTVSPLSSQRLPSPLSDTAVSPLALAVSPELPGEPKPITRKAVGAPEAQIRHAKSNPALVSESKSLGLGVRTLAGLPTSPRPDLGQGPNQTQFPAHSERPDQKQSPDQKQYIPYSPALAGNQVPNQIQFPTRTASREDDDQSAQPTTPRQEASQFPALPAISQRQKEPEPQSPHRGGPKRTISETGSIETVKAPAAATKPPIIREPDHIPSLALDNNKNDHLPLREPDPSQPDHTDHPGAALFPRNWYTPLPADDIPDARPLTDRHYRCLTQHRYMTANKQRTNPVACRTCGHKDRNAECYICSACHLNVCSGCAGLLKRFKGDLRAVLKEVREKKSMEGEKPLGGAVNGQQG